MPVTILMYVCGAIKQPNVPNGRQATVEAVSKLVCLTLDRDTFVEILGPLEQIMAREKSAQVSDGTCQGCHVR